MKIPRVTTIFRYEAPEHIIKGTNTVIVDLNFNKNIISSCLYPNPWHYHPIGFNMIFWLNLINRIDILRLVQSSPNFFLNWHKTQLTGHGLLYGELITRTTYFSSYLQLTSLKILPEIWVEQNLDQNPLWVSTIAGREKLEWGLEWNLEWDMCCDIYFRLSSI